MMSTFIHPQDILNSTARAFITKAEPINPHGINKLLGAISAHGAHDPRAVFSAYYKTHCDPIKEVDTIQGLIIPDTELAANTRRVLSIYEEVRPRDIKDTLLKFTEPKIVKAPATSDANYFVVVSAQYLDQMGLYAHVETLIQEKLNQGQGLLSVGNNYGALDMALREDRSLDLYDPKTQEQPLQEGGSFRPYAGQPFIVDVQAPVFSKTLDDPILTTIPCWDKNSDEAKEQAIRNAVLLSRDTGRWIAADIGETTVLVMANPIQQGLPERAFGHGQSNMNKVFSIAAGEQEERDLFVLKDPKITFRVSTDMKAAKQWNAAHIMMQAAEADL